MLCKFLHVVTVPLDEKGVLSLFLQSLWNPDTLSAVSLVCFPNSIAQAVNRVFGNITRSQI